MARPPVANAALVVRDGLIQAIGRWEDLRSQVSGRVVDLGEVVVFPGLVNAHCHLDYTSMAGQITPSGSFTDWITGINSLKATWGYADYARSWLAGARMLIESGTTLVGDIEAVPELLPEVWEATPLRVFSFLEMTGVKSRRDPATLLADNLIRADGLRHPRSLAWLSPHAPYSTTPALLSLAAEAVGARNWRVCTHVAESAEEYDMFRRGRGPMYSWLERNERDMSDCGGITPVAHLARQGLLSERCLAVHANYLESGDVELLADRRAHVVHCPRSHAYFGHRSFPYHSLVRAGVNLCLGTDSLATVLRPRTGTLRLDMRTELRAFRASVTGVSPEQAWRLVTLNGARALGVAGRAGELSPGAWADLLILPFGGRMEDVYEAALHDAGRVRGVMIDGHWALAPESEAG